MGGSYSYNVLATSDENDLLTSSLANERMISRPEYALQIREPLHSGSINALAPVQNDVVISAGVDKKIVVQDLAAGGFITRFIGHEKEVTKLIYKHINGHDYILSGSLDDTIRLWQFGVPSPIAIYREPGMNVAGLAEISENLMISGSTDEKMRLWDVNTRKVIKTVHTPDNYVTHISNSSCHGIAAQTSIDKTLKIWDTRSLQLVFTSVPRHFPLLHCDIKDSTYCITSSDGNQNYEGCEISLWDLRNQRIVTNFRGHDSPVRSAIFLPQQITWKRLILSVSADHRIFVWDTDQGGVIWKENLPGGGPLNCCAAFSDGGIAVGGSDGFLFTTKLSSKSGTIFLTPQSVQTNLYESLQAAQDLESIGLT